MSFKLLVTCYPANYNLKKPASNLNPFEAFFISYKKEDVYFVDLSNILLCSLFETTQSRLGTISKVEIELIHKDTMKKEMIPIYNIDNPFFRFLIVYLKIINWQKNGLF